MISHLIYKNLISLNRLMHNKCLGKHIAVRRCYVKTFHDSHTPTRRERERERERVIIVGGTIDYSVILSRQKEPNNS